MRPFSGRTPPRNVRRRRILPRLDRRGFGMMMAMFAVAAAGIGTTALVIVSSTTRMQLRWNLTKKYLTRYETAFANFKKDTGVYPSTFQQLNTKPSLSDDSLCRNRFIQKQLDGWKGPYLQQVVPSTGAVVGVGLAIGPFDPDKSGIPNNLIMHITNVRPMDAERMDKIYDNADGRQAGHVQWAVLTGLERLLTVDYYVSVTGC